MLPLKDNVPTVRFPVVTVAIIAANVVVWLWQVRTGIDRTVLHDGYYPCSLRGPCRPPASEFHHLHWWQGAFSTGSFEDTDPANGENVAPRRRFFQGAMVTCNSAANSIVRSLSRAAHFSSARMSLPTTPSNIVRPLTTTVTARFRSN